MAHQRATVDRTTTTTAGVSIRSVESLGFVVVTLNESFTLTPRPNRIDIRDELWRRALCSCTGTVEAVELFERSILHDRRDASHQIPKALHNLLIAPEIETFLKDKSDRYFVPCTSRGSLLRTHHLALAMLLLLIL